MTHTKNPRIHALLAALAIAATFAIGTPTATAGTYHVYQCHGAHGHATSGWTWGGDTFPYGVRGCSNAFKLIATTNGAIGSDGMPLGATGPGRNEYWQTPALPGGMKFAQADFWSASDTGGGSTSLSMGYCTGSSSWYGRCAYSDGVTIDSGTIRYSAACRHWAYECQTAQFALQTADGGRHSAFGNLFFYDVDFTVVDPNAPTVWQPHDGSLRNDNSTNPWTDGNYWNNGSRTTGVYGYDPGQSGVMRTQIYFDGDPNNSQLTQVFDQSCDYAAWRPCPESANDTATINTGAFADGPHTATTRAVDAAGNQSEATTLFKVDNTAPSTPAGIAVSGTSAGWSATNNFAITWINPTEEREDSTHSGVDQVKVDVQPTEAGTQPNPAPITVPVGQTVSGISATRTSVSGVTVPAAGAWTLRLSVIDKAGNESSVGDGSGGGTDSDTAIGYDPTPPAKPAGQANGWISRADLANGYDQQWDYTPPGNAYAPICGFAGSITPSDADPGSTINISGNVHKWRLPANLAEATHKVNLRAVTCAGLASPATEHVEAKVDLTDPSASITGVEEDHWYKDGQAIGLHGADALSGMAPASNSDPDARNGAYLSYTINGDGPTAANSPRGADAPITVTGEGQKELRFSPVDVAGNKAVPTIVKFGIDATNPTGHFAARSTSNPRLLRAPIGDGVSGIALAVIEVRQQGRADWQLLPTSLADVSGNPIGGYPTSGVASAVFPDTALPQGTYVARVRAYDQAGNELATSKDEYGNTFTFDNPMREGVNLSAGLSKAKRSCNQKRGVKCVLNARGKVVFTGTYPTLAVGYKRGAVVQGFLTSDPVTRLARQPIEIYSKSKNSDEQLIGTTATRADGSYLFKIKPGVSRTIRVFFPGTDTLQDASTSVQLGTGAKLKLRVSDRHAHTGETVTFRGTVHSFDGVVPAGGKIVALQFYAGRKWRPAVGIAHTDTNGNFAIKYTFDSISKGRKARIVFRVYAPSEEGWNHVASASRRITMRLN